MVPENQFSIDILLPTKLMTLIEIEKGKRARLELDFTKHALSDLVKRGEITEQNDLNNNTFYGLPHSSLADAYWEHGRKYIRRMEFRKYEEFIYDYATSIVPNGLQAVYVANEDSRKAVLRRIKRNRERKSSELTSFLNLCEPMPKRPASTIKKITEVCQNILWYSCHRDNRIIACSKFT